MNVETCECGHARHYRRDDCVVCAREEAAEILQEFQAKSLRLVMERGKLIAELRTALVSARAELGSVRRAAHNLEYERLSALIHRIDALLERSKP